MLSELTEALSGHRAEDWETMSRALAGLGTEWKSRADFVVARALLEQGTETKLAETLLVELLDRYEPIQDHVQYQLARALNMNGRVLPAISVLERLMLEQTATQLRSRTVVFWSELQLEQGHASRVLPVLTPFLGETYRPESNPARFLLTKAFIALDQPEEARSLLKDIVIHVPHTSDADQAQKILDTLGPVVLSFAERVERAGALVRYRKYDEASTEYEALLAESPDDPMLTEALGRSLFSSREYDRASQVLGKAGSADTAYLEVRSLYRSGNQEEFLRRLGEVEASYPALNRKLYLLRLAAAQDLRRARRFEEANESLRALLNAYPDKAASTLWELGWSHYSRGDYSAAQETFLKLSTVGGEERRDKALYWMARCAEMLGDSGMAEELFGQVRTEYPDTYYGLISGHSSRAVDPGDIALSRAPQFPENSHFMRIEELRLVGLTEDAREELDTLALSLETTEEALAFGYLASRCQDYRRAIQLSEPLSRIDSRFKQLAYPRGYWPTLESAGLRENIDPYFLAAVIRKESRFNPKAHSGAGAMGLMQLMPSTARLVSVSNGMELEAETDLFDPEINIRIGSHYLAGLIREYGQNLVLAAAAYNAGRKAVGMWMERRPAVPADEFIEEISYPETREYVKQVLKNYIHYRELWGLTPPTLSAMVGASDPARF